MRFKTVWIRHRSHRSSLPFFSLSVGKPFNWNDSHIIIGTLDGQLRFIPIFATEEENEHTICCQESAISCILLHPVINLQKIDLIAGDLTGNLFVIMNGQIVARHLFNHPITAISIDRNIHTPTVLFVGDLGGYLTGIKPLLSQNKEYVVKPLPLCTSKNFSIEEPSPGQPSQSDNSQTYSGEHVPSYFDTADRDLSISTIHSVILPDVSGTPSHFQIVTNHSAWLYLYNLNVCVARIACPDIILAVCCGSFTTEGKVGSPQIAVSCKDSNIYIMENYQISKLTSVDFSVTQLAAIKDAEHPSLERDLLLCAGHFNSIYVYRGSQLVAEKETGDWVHCLQVCRLEQGKRQTPQEYVIAGQLDNTIQIFELESDEA
ncbi:uncharacterized protein LOC126316745 [Schistocerca gregaria]|uniref:uncharacterized protein LOC126316745 n=1 Tax=Schistocerca gregaria TaxID=7010 RepID=UPI00211E3016|nr:uncharacterized protein LOC126316745 [Schistocerca gregaria]